MKFRCERDSLLEVLQTAGGALRNSLNTGRALNGIRLEVSGNRLLAVGTDLDLTIHVSSEVTGLVDGVCVAPTPLLADIVKLMAPGAVTIQAEDEKIDVSLARSQFTINTMAAEDFPDLPEPAPASTFLEARSFAGALKQVVRAAKNPKHAVGQPLLTGVLIAPESNGVRLVATDSFRLALRDLPGSNSLVQGEQILVPARALMELQRLSVVANAIKTSVADSGQEANQIGLTFGERWATFSVSGVHISTRLVDGDYPDYRQLIPSSYPNQLEVGKDSLLEALRRVRLLVTNERTPVRLRLRAGAVDLEVASQEVGEAKETVDADYRGDDLVIAFNPTYLIDGVEAVPGDVVILETVDASKPATIRGADEGQFYYLLMPVRVIN